MTVTVRPAVANGKRCWCVDRREGGKRRRTYFPSRGKADAYAAEVRLLAEQAGQEWTRLTDADRRDAARWWVECRRSGLDPWGLLADAQNRPHGARSRSLALDDAAGRFLASRGNLGRSDAYLVAMRQLLTRFCAGREAMPVAQVSTDTVREFMDGLPSLSRQTTRARLSTWFRWLVREGQIAGNPCDRLEVSHGHRHPPTILTLQQVRDCIDWLQDEPTALGWFVLGTFAGLRPEEADATPWANIRDGVVIVDAQASKVRRRRVVDLETAAGAWMETARRLGARQPIPRSTRRREIRRLREHLEWAEWPKDVTRHTAASMLLALHQDAGRVALLLGNSPGVLLTHYRALVTREQAAEFWAILPESKAPHA